MTRMKDTLQARRPSRLITAAKAGADLREDPARSVARTSWAAYGACALAFAYAGVSLYWALGGTGGLNTVGGFAERAVRSPDGAALTLIWVTVVVKDSEVSSRSRWCGPGERGYLADWFCSPEPSHPPF